MPRLSLRATNQLQKLALGCVALVAMQSHAFATTAEIPSLPRTVTGVVTSDDRALQLDVFINGRPVHILAAFVQGKDGRLHTTRKELESIGIRPPAGAAEVYLDQLPKVTVKFEESTQSIHFVAPDEQLLPHDYNTRDDGTARPRAHTDPGAVLNYDLYTAALRSTQNPNVVFQGASANLDARVFSSLGTISQTGVISTDGTGKKINMVRLDTSWTYSSPDSLMAYKGGDLISSGLPWTRPIRMGGLQVQRNFGLRPDLVTTPMPSVNGSAAVPSSLDVYVNNVRTFSENVEAGPYRVSNLPLIGGDGTAKVVTRDASGKETTTEVPFFASSRLLRAGLMDYSGELGFARQYYDVESTSYSKKLVGSASLRRGIFDWLTVEGHAEGGAGLENAGVGLAARTFNRGIVTAAVSGSHINGGNGMQAFAGFDTRLFGMFIGGSMQRSFGNYQDLASVTAPSGPSGASNACTTVSTSVAWNPGFTTICAQLKPPKAQDRISLGVPVPFDKSTLGASFIRTTDANGKKSQIASLNYSRNLFYDASMFISAYHDFVPNPNAAATAKHRRDTGVVFGVSMPLGSRISASSSVSASQSGVNFDTNASRALDREVGSYGWRLHDSEGKASYRTADASYRADFARLNAGVAQYGSQASVNAEAEGAIAVLGGGVFLSNRIDDSFAVVDAGLPGVDVLYENQKIGKTNSSGKRLVPNLRAFESNKVTIDPNGLPLDAETGLTQSVVSPNDRSGVVVNFGVKKNVQAAIVIINDKAGKPLSAGLSGTLSGTNEAFVTGYDGRSYIRQLSAQNRITIENAGQNCTAQFNYTPQPGTQVVVGPIVCQ